MKYYQVLESADQARVYEKMYTGHYRIGFTLIRNELYTERELKKFNVPSKYVREVNIPKTETYWCFGARFARDKKEVNT